MKKWMTAALPFALLAALGAYLLSRTDATSSEASAYWAADTSATAADAIQAPQATGTLGDLAARPDRRLQLDPGRRLPGQVQARRLEAEAAYFSGADLSMPVVERTITGKSFDRELSRLERQMALDPAASELGQLYREALKTQFASSGLGDGAYRLACGRSLCMGSITTRAPEATYQQWWNTFETSPAVPHTIGGDYSVALGGGLYERRFMFVTDGDTRSISGRPKG